METIKVGCQWIHNELFEFSRFVKNKDGFWDIATARMKVKNAEFDYLHKSGDCILVMTPEQFAKIDGLTFKS